ncbi:hypothetical protein BN871_AF_00150 [Paenibacillus sp. P22]|nr:hypothetical protein BN871_AF_00150 [Paenibacillus sp. P22]
MTEKQRWKRELLGGWLEGGGSRAGHDGCASEMRIYPNHAD